MTRNLRIWLIALTVTVTGIVGYLVIQRGWSRPAGEMPAGDRLATDSAALAVLAGDLVSVKLLRYPPEITENTSSFTVEGGRVEVYGGCILVTGKDGRKDLRRHGEYQGLVLKVDLPRPRNPAFSGSLRTLIVHEDGPIQAGKPRGNVLDFDDGRGGRVDVYAEFLLVTRDGESRLFPRKVCYNLRFE